VHFVETSRVLRDAQKAAVPEARWQDSVADLPQAPLVVAANEFLDALPIIQTIGGIERRVTIAAGGLAFDRDGEIVEKSPARHEAVSTLSRHLAANGGAAIIIDYGHERSGPGDTLQAVHAHGFAPVLDRPGEQDLTAHVDFEAVARSALDAGARVTPLATQAEWLLRLGIEARAQALARANPDRVQDLEAAVHRLTAPDEMGVLFKVIGIHSPDWPAPAGFE
jgi:NADH dehydrogenase [ubiquinone] 1 alpha subcomplex assembly factor 7